MVLTENKEMMVNRSIAPRIKDAVEFDIQLPPCEKHVLSNGVEVYVVNMGTEETMMVNWVFFAGNWYETKKNVAAATNYLLKNGTSKRSAFNINEHFEYYGSYLNRNSFNETAELTLHCLNKHIDELLPVVAEIIPDAIFPAEELAIYVQNSQQRLKVSLQKCEFVAGRVIDAYLFGEDHPYGKYSSLEEYSDLRRDDLLSFYRQYYQQGRCIIFVSGKLPLDIIDKLEKHFGGLSLGSHRDESEVIQHPVRPATLRKYDIMNDMDGVQAAIRIARLFPNRHHPDFQKAMVLNNIFGGFFGSRLMTNIREDKGYTYGIYSYLMNHIQESGWMISTEAGKEVSSATIEEIYSEMKILREDRIDEEELLMTRNFMIGTILSDLDGPFQVAARWKNLILNDLDAAYFYNSIQTIKSVSSLELQELANKYFNPEAFIELVVI